MNIDEYRKRIGEMADELASAERSADSAGTLDRAAMMAEMFESDDWLELAAELVPLPKSTGSPYKRREKTRPRFAKFNAKLAEADGHTPISPRHTQRLMDAAEVLPFLKNATQGHAFRTERSVRPLGLLIRNGLGERIPEAITLATADGAPLTARTLSDSVAVVKKKALAGSRGALVRAGRRAARAKAARDEAFAALADEVRAAIAAGMTEVDAARLAGVDRMTIRRWVGKL